MVSITVSIILIAIYDSKMFSFFLGSYGSIKLFLANKHLSTARRNNLYQIQFLPIKKSVFKLTIFIHLQVIPGLLILKIYFPYMNISWTLCLSNNSNFKRVLHDVFGTLCFLEIKQFLYTILLLHSTHYNLPCPSTSQHIPSPSQFCLFVANWI